MSKPGISKEGHIELGQKLSAVYAELITISVKVHNAYPQSNRAYRPASKAWRAVDHLRSELEEVMFREHPDMGTDVYYPRK